MLTSPVSTNMLSQIADACHCQRHTLRMRILCSLHSTTHTHTYIVINQRRFDMQILHAKGISQLLIPVPNPDFDSNFHSNFDLALLPFPTPCLLHLSLPWPTHPKLSCPSCRCVSKQPQISLTLQRFRQTKKKRKQSNVERKSAHYFPLRLNSAPITVPPPLHSLSPTLLHSAPPLLPSFVARKGCLALRLAPKVVHVVQLVVLAVFACFGFFA